MFEILLNIFQPHRVILVLKITAGRGHDGTIYKFPYYFSGVVNGTIEERELVFADGGKPNQIQQLKDRGISVKGKIVLLLNVLPDVSFILLC